MSRIPLLAVRALAALVLAVGVIVLSVAPASAQPSDTPVSGDVRATAHPDNIKQDDCAAAGLAGSAIAVRSTIVDGTYITITSVPDGYALTGVVVKGGPASNVYAGDLRAGLHAPLVSSKKPAGISHWFACGTPVVAAKAKPAVTAPDSKAVTAPQARAATAPQPKVVTAPETKMVRPAGPATESTTTIAAAGSSHGGGELANTGFSAASSLLAAGALLLIGASLLLATRRRAVARR